MTVVARQEHVRLAQLDRAFGYGPKGREFESSNAHNKKTQALPEFFLSNKMAREAWHRLVQTPVFVAYRRFVIYFVVGYIAQNIVILPRKFVSAG